MPDNGTLYKMDVYSSNGQTFIGSFDDSRLVALSIERSLFKDRSPGVGGTVVGQMDVQFLPWNAREQDVTIPRMAKLVPYTCYTWIQHETHTATVPRGRMHGDANGDGVIDGTDLTLIARYVSKIENPPDPRTEAFHAADANNDGELKANDMSLVSYLMQGKVNIGSQPEITGNWINIPTAEVGAAQFYCDVTVSGVSGRSVTVTAGSWFSHAVPLAGNTLRVYAFVCPVAAETITVEWDTTLYTEWEKKGEYWIDTREVDDETGVMRVQAFDAMLKGEQLFCDDGVVEHWPRTDIQVLNGFTADGVTYPGIAQKLGVSIDSASLARINKGYLIQFPGTVQTDGQAETSVQGAAMTVREVLSAICAAYACNATMAYSGELQLVPLRGQGTTFDIGESVGSFSAIPKFSAFDRVEVVVSSEESYFYPTQETDGRTLIAECLWGTAQMAQNIYNLVHGYEYQPFEAGDALISASAQPGDFVSVNGITGVIGSISWDADNLFAANLSAPQDEEIDHEYPYESKQNREVNRKLATTSARLTVEASKIEAIVENIGEDGAVTAASIVAKINDSESEVKISADHIVLDGLVTADEFEAATARISTLEANSATVSQLNAAEARIASIESNYITASYVSANYTNTTTLYAQFVEAGGSTITNLNAKIANVEKIYSSTASANHIYSTYISAKTGLYIHVNGITGTKLVGSSSVTIGGHVYNILTI